MELEIVQGYGLFLNRKLRGDTYSGQQNACCLHGPIRWISKFTWCSIAHAFRVTGLKRLLYNFRRCKTASLGLCGKNLLKLAVLCGSEGRYYCLCPVNHRKTGQLRSSVSSCMRKRVNSVCFECITFWDYQKNKQINI